MKACVKVLIIGLLNLKIYLNKISVNTIYDSARNQ